ncbi:MAG TPA: response regulator [Candidatus Tectomicrobia bacterium]|nr:response regulator [Candidatus Tectomicrobia bacterium]
MPIMPEAHALRFLIADDDPADRRRLLHSLRKGFPGAVWQQITSPQDLDAAMAQSRFDLVVTEYQLTWSNGLEVLRKIRSRFPHTPVIWVSSSSCDETIAEGMKAGLNDYVSKANLQRLLTAVRDSLREASARREQAQQLQALRASEQRYRAIAELTSDYAYRLRIEADDMVVCDWANERFTYITEYTLEALNRQGGWTSLFHPEDKAIAAQRQARWLAGQTDISEFRIMTRSGKERWLRDYTCPVHDADQTYVMRVHGAGQDITQRRRLEEPLQQAQKMEAIGRLAGGIAHDFNNLLQVVSGYSDLVLRRLTRRSAIRQYVQEIKNAAEQGAMLTRQLMIVSRKPVLQSEVLDFKGIINKITPILQRVLGEDIELTTSVDPTLGYVTADPGQLEQVILNLVVNARDAMPQGGHLTLEAANVEIDEAHIGQLSGMAPGGYIKLTVSDTGSGMDTETQAHIFEPFFTTKEPGKGTGLGLFTVYGIVSQNGGNMQVESAPGVGSTFTIHLPRVDGPVEEVKVQCVPQHAPPAGETILLLEDEAVVRDLVRQVLQATGYTVLEAANGEQAMQLSQAHRGPIHLLLADVVLPGLSGPEVAEQVAVARPELQVIYMSGYAQDTIRCYGLSERQGVFLQKPFAPATLLTSVREALDASKT